MTRITEITEDVNKAEPIASKTTVEAVANASDSDDDDDDEDDTPATNAAGKVISRGEKKARKALQKLGLKPVAGIQRVTIKRGRGQIFVVTNPEVYRVPGSDTFIVYGEAKVEDPNQLQQAMAQAGRAAGSLNPATVAAAASAAAPAPVEEEEDEVDATGIVEGDIELVVAQTNVSRNKAIKALKNANGDIVTAIMELTN